MKRFCAAGMLAATLASAAFGQSSKATAMINTVSGEWCGSKTSSVCPAAWVPVMTSSIKTSSIADLFVDVSLVTGLYTSTTVKGNDTGATSKAVATGTVEVRVVMDPGTSGAKYGQPDPLGTGVIFDQRIQTMTANLGYIFTKCFADGGTTATGCTLTPEEITLALETMAAHSFTFIFTTVGTGTHTIQVQARRSTSDDTSGGTGGVAVSGALYGLGSTTVESVRLVNSFQF